MNLSDGVEGVLKGDRAALGKTITLVESTHPQHQDLAQEILTALLPHSGKAIRVGITGIPGVGKSTFIETLGSSLIRAGKKVAVLAVDPSSAKSGGSILADKTRMPRLAAEPDAFIRPSPSAGTLGGVASKTRESMIVCEAAGYDVILVETVGVGQSETVVAQMTDCFVVLILPGAGDELQGIKKGILELVDVLVINQADGANEKPAEATANHYRSAFHLKAPREGGRDAHVFTCSARENRGLDTVWKTIEAHHRDLRASGNLEKIRNTQRLAWMRSIVEEELLRRFHQDPRVQKAWEQREKEILAGKKPATVAAREILEEYLPLH